MRHSVQVPPTPSHEVEKFETLAYDGLQVQNSCCAVIPRHKFPGPHCLQESSVPLHFAAVLDFDTYPGEHVQDTGCAEFPMHARPGSQPAVKQVPAVFTHADETRETLV